MNKIFFWVMIIGIVIMSFANVVGIGYGLYLWASIGLAFKTAVWQAFIIWAEMIITGLFLFFGGYMGTDYVF